jgi:hypothetical protein
VNLSELKEMVIKPVMRMKIKERRIKNEVEIIFFTKMTKQLLLKKYLLKRIYKI